MTTHFLVSMFLMLQSWVGYFDVPDAAILNLSTTTTAKVVKVVDGDTIDVRLTDTFPVVRVRYIGIDTPEPYAHQVPDCGSAEASLRNRELVAGKVVTVVPGTDPYDTYGRLLAYVYVDAVFVNELLIHEGFAKVLMIAPNTEYRARFSSLYKVAKDTKLGIWANCL